jgi:hypothetical protein
MARRSTLARMSLALSTLLARHASCRSSSGPGSLDTVGATAPAAASTAVDGAPRPQIELTWRLFETQRWLEGSSRHESAVIELLINGGEPARVDLGRRDSAGCTVEGASAVALTTLACSNARALVSRSGDLELRVVAGEPSPGDVVAADSEPPLTRVRTATVRVPPGADVVVAPELSRIPDEAPSP